MTTLKVGDVAPDFERPIQDGSIVKKSDYKNKKLILFFYPKDNTPGCNAEACSLRDSYKELREMGYHLLGISADSLRKHNNFIKKFDLPFDLISDVDKEMINAYKVWGPKKFMGLEFDGIYRTTFLINEDGIIEQVITKVKTKDHAEQIIDLVA